MQLDRTTGIRPIRPKYDVVGTKKVWYLIRIKTFKSTNQGINICLLNSNNECVMHRFSPPFDRGIRDDMFEGNDVGDVVSVMAAPENGSWGLDEITLSVRGTRKTFVYNKMIGGRDADTELAAFMTKTKTIVTPEMKNLWDREYEDLKNQLVVGTVQLTAIGTVLTAAAVGADKAAAFASGGTLALAYALLLQWEIDDISKSRASYSVLRLAALFGLAATLVIVFHDNIKGDNQLFIFGMFGFMSYKASIIMGGGLAPPIPPLPLPLPLPHPTPLPLLPDIDIDSE
jgi:hypothetical protein